MQPDVKVEIGNEMGDGGAANTACAEDQPVCSIDLTSDSESDTGIHYIYFIYSFEKRLKPFLFDYTADSVVEIIDEANTVARKAQPATAQRLNAAGDSWNASAFEMSAAVNQFFADTSFANWSPSNATAVNERNDARGFELDEMPSSTPKPATEFDFNFNEICETGASPLCLLIP